MPKKNPAVDKLADIAIHGMLEKKAHNIVKIDLRNLTSAVTDVMLICHGESDRQVSAIAESVIHEIKKATGENPFGKEGYSVGEWVLVDYVNVVIHVFKGDMRSFYALEDLWADGDIQEITTD
ncbi:MAG: ribosome silencing factor [Bacteroidetes bacterium]|jgi:ribosome-associated protein|nr:ribosome silencing factor [Bacteroidota bacterium]